MTCTELKASYEGDKTRDKPKEGSNNHLPVKGSRIHNSRNMYKGTMKNKSFKTQCLNPRCVFLKGEKERKKYKS